MSSLSPAKTSQQVTLLPDPALPGLSRPLAVVGHHTYVAIWPYVNRGQSANPVARELILVRDDSQLLVTPPKPSSRSIIRHSKATEPQPPTDWFLPIRPPLPADRLWSGTGVQRYLDGHRPDPAAVFSSLVAVLNQFVDFTGSLGAPALMAEFFATYLLTTWFSPAFPFLGLLWLTGDNGAGKSRLLALLARLAHLGLYLPVPPPPAALRSVASLGASLAVDDADFLSPRPNNGQWSVSTRHALLLAGRQRGALLPVTLAEPGSPAGARHTRQLDVSGPRLFASVRPPHPSIARYFLVVPLVRTPEASLAAADPADPAAWPAGLTLTGLVDDLWALALSRLHELPPHLPLAAHAAASADTHSHPSLDVQRPGLRPSSLSLPTSHLPLAAQAAASLPPTPPSRSTPNEASGHTHTPTHALPLLGSSLQPWHALLATASWLSSAGVPGLLDRLLGLAQAYQAQRPASETADFTILVLRAVIDCVSTIFQNQIDQDQAAHIAEYNRAGGTVDDDEDETNDDATGNDAFDTNDAKREKALRNFERRLARDDWARAHPNTAPVDLPFPPSFAFNAGMVLDALRGLAPDLAPDLPLDSLTPSLVGRTLNQLRFKPHRTATLRVWGITTLSLARLARAYGVPVPSHLADHFAAALPSSSTPPS
jgi:hypothetical protein